MAMVSLGGTRCRGGGSDEDGRDLGFLSLCVGVVRNGVWLGVVREIEEERLGGLVSLKLSVLGYEVGLIF